MANNENQVEGVEVFDSDDLAHQAGESQASIARTPCAAPSPQDQVCPQPARLLRSFDQSAIPFEEAEIFTKLLQMVDDSRQLATSAEFFAELLAFGMVESGGDGVYYGGKRKIPSPSEGGFAYRDLRELVSVEHVHHWRSRLQTCSHPKLRLRYSDLIWEFSTVFDDLAPTQQIAETVVDETIQLLSLESGFQFSFEAKNKIARATHVALSIQDFGRLSNLVDSLIAFEDRHADDLKPGTWGFAFDLGLSDKRVSRHLSEAQRDSIIRSLSDRFGRLMENPCLNSLFACTARLGTFYHKRQDQGKVRSLLKEFDATLIRLTGGMSSIVADEWLRKGLHLHKTLNTSQSDRSRLLKAAQGLPPGSMTCVEGTVDIPREMIDALLDSFTSAGIHDSLQRMGTSFVPSIQEVAKIKVQDEADHIHTLFASRTIQTTTGRTVAAGPSAVEDPPSAFNRVFVSQMRAQAVFFDLCFDHLAKNLSLNCASFLEYLFACDAYKLPEVVQRKTIIEMGVSHYFSEDWISCCHVLVPQIEYITRTLVLKLGGSVYRENRHGGFDLRTLAELLGTDQFLSAFSESYRLYLRLVLTEGIGFNWRNSLCHGLLEESRFTRRFASQLLHVFLIYGALQIDVGKHGQP